MKKYHTHLPDILERYYVYEAGSGHCIEVLTIGDSLKVSGMNSEYVSDLLVPCPVITVLKGYKIVKCKDGQEFVVSEVAEYNDELGLITDPNDEEF
ncbi:MAG TPA: hypothetical protein VK179_19425 [Bacteroidales bacterium]|nr:hypothetical protein [Bacteroidales bacterium]